ncbi:MAG TPA: hypothetical protein VIL48_17275 [Acidimicrobiales bacterium]
MKGLINGAEAWETPGGLLRLTDVAEDGRSAVLELTDGDAVVWETPLAGLSSDPLSPAADVAHLDLRAAVWPGGGAVVLAGGDRAWVVGLGDGRVRRDLALEFTDKESLDVLELVAVPDSPVFVVVSTRRVWVLGYPGPDDALRYESDGPITAFDGWDGGVLRVCEYDVLDPELPVVERAVDFRP